MWIHEGSAGFFEKRDGIKVEGERVNVSLEFGSTMSRFKQIRVLRIYYEYGAN